MLKKNLSAFYSNAFENKFKLIKVKKSTTIKVKTRALTQDLFLINATFDSVGIFMNQITGSSLEEKERIKFLAEAFPRLQLLANSFLVALASRSSLPMLSQISMEYSQTNLKKKSKTNLIFSKPFDQNLRFKVQKLLQNFVTPKDIILKFMYVSKFLGGITIEQSSIILDITALNAYRSFLLLDKK